MKILIVGMPFSIHTVRWINSIDKSMHQVHFMSSFEYATPEITFPDNVYYHDYPYSQVSKRHNFRTFNNKKFRFPARYSKIIGKAYRMGNTKTDYHQQLKKLINAIKPDVIHSMESQHAGYLVSKFYQEDNKLKPFWIHSTYGIDLHFFSRLPHHRQMLKQMFKNINIFLSEGFRDKNLSYDLDYNGPVEIFPSAGGGYDLSLFKDHLNIKPAQRKIILVKGYSGALRRGFVALRAISMCMHLLKGYKIYAIGCTKEVVDYISYINDENPYPIEIFQNRTYREFVQVLCETRISITVNLSDGIPSTLFESMLSGAFPIQSRTSMANEWINNGETGFLVPPEDPEEISKYIKEALENDFLVDKAATINYACVAQALELDKVKKRINKFYSSIQVN